MSSVHTFGKSRRYSVGDYGSPNHVAPVKIQSASLAQTADSIKLAFPGSVTQGNLLVIGFGYYNSANAPVCTDNLGTVYTKAGPSKQLVIGDPIYSAFFVGRAPASGLCGVTCSVAGGSYEQIGLVEFSGYGSLLPASTMLTASTGPNSLGAIPVPVFEPGGALVFGIEATYNSSNILNAVAPFTQVCFVNNADTMAMCYYYTTGSGVYVPSFSHNATNWCLTGIAIG